MRHHLGGDCLAKSIWWAAVPVRNAFAQMGRLDWENERMAVPEPKVEHHEGRSVRLVPIFPELLPHLEAAWKEATVGNVYPSPDAYVVNKPTYREAAMRLGECEFANAVSQNSTAGGRAPRKRLFHSMRATRQTEMERDFPLQVVRAWLGNTEAVAKKNYLLVTEDDFKKAAHNAAHSVSKTAHFEAQQGSANSTRENAKTPENISKNAVFAVFSGVQMMEDNGLEPMTYCMPCNRSPN